MKTRVDLKYFFHVFSIKLLSNVFTVAKANIRNESETEYFINKCHLKKYLVGGISKSQNHDSTLLNDPEYKDFQIKNPNMTLLSTSHNSSISVDLSYQLSTPQPHRKVYPLRNRHSKRVAVDKGVRFFVEVTDL